MLESDLLLYVILCYLSDRSSPWMTVDTTVFIMSAGENKEDSTLVHFTESKDKEVSPFQTSNLSPPMMLCVLMEKIYFSHLPYENARIC